MNPLKNLVLALAASAPAAAALAAPTLTIDSVRQRWPFSQKVDVAFTVTGADDGELYALRDFKVFDGAREVDHPGVFAFEGIRPAYGNGSFSIAFDPSRSLLTNTVAVNRFKVSFDITPSPVRYLIIDLAKDIGAPGCVEYIYAGDSRLESFTQTVSYTDSNGDAATASITYDEAFLSLTNATFNVRDQSSVAMVSPYLVTKMAFRLVKPGTYRVGKGAIGASDGNKVTFTKPYFISVFPMTKAQYGQIRYGNWVQRDNNGTSASWELWSQDTGYATYWQNRPEQALAYATYNDYVRGLHGDEANPVDWIQYGHAVAPESLFGIARAKYGFGFDYATEAQWEVACRAGTTGYYYVNKEVTEKDAALFALLGNTPSNTETAMPLGTHLANAWGLYDMLGGRGEAVLDNMVWGVNVNDGAWPSGTDPVGAVTEYNEYLYSRGGGSSSGVLVSCGLRSGGAKASTQNHDWGDTYFQAIRVVINAN